MPSTIRGPWPPNLQNIAIEFWQIIALRPQAEQWALQVSTMLAVGFVVKAICRRPGAIVLQLECAIGIPHLDT